jgi:hypothetical protein
VVSNIDLEEIVIKMIRCFFVNLNKNPVGVIYYY